MPTQSKWQSLPTEAINPVSLAIDKAPVRDIVDMVVNEDRKMLAAVQKEKERIALGIEIIAQALRKGGRIIFVGAGTSGRLGVLEAAEMPPTFGTAPRIVQAIMAGGQEAVFKAKEGVEDNYEEGARSIARLRLTKKDVVIGVSASGMTPFVRGGLTRARKAGAKIIFVTCWPGSELQTFVDLQIAPAVGPEVIAGSTRLKAGTATKMVLNMLTTVAMIKIGKTYGNLMVDVQTGSEKLKDRARRIVSIVTGLDYDDADALLKRAQVERQGRDRDAEDRPDAAAGAATPEEGGRLGPRGDRRGRRAAAPRAADTDDRRRSVGPLGGLSASLGLARLGASVPPRRGIDDDVDGRVQLQKRRRQLRRDRLRSTSRATQRAFASPGRQQDDRSRLKNRRHPHRQRLGRAPRSASPPNSAALLRRVSGRSVTRCVRACSVGAGSLKPMWPLVPMPENLQVDAAGPRDRPLVALALRLGIGRVAPSRKLICDAGRLTRSNRCVSMKRR